MVGRGGDGREGGSEEPNKWKWVLPVLSPGYATQQIADLFARVGTYISKAPQ